MAQKSRYIELELLMSWVTIIGWTVLSVAAALSGARKAYVLAAGEKTRSEKWILLRSLLKRLGLFGLALTLASCLLLDISLHTERGLSLMIAGMSFIVLTALQQIAFAIGIHTPFVAIRGDDWSLKTLIFRMTITAWSLCLPLGLTTMLFGAAMNLMDSAVSIETEILLCGIVVLWVLQWGVLRALTLPGRLVDFPKSEWESEAKTVAKSIGTNLTDLMMLQTGKARVAGAFALGRGNVAITDYLLSALTQSEFMAIMAHELQHFTQRRQTIVLITKLFLICGLIGALIAFLFIKYELPESIACGGSLIVAVLSIRPIHKLKKFHEDDADDAAIKEIGAMPLMNALAKTYALNGRLDDRKGGTLHRGIRERLTRIASQANLNEEAIELALADARTLVPEFGQVSFQRV